MSDEKNEGGKVIWITDLLREIAKEPVPKLTAPLLNVQRGNSCFPHAFVMSEEKHTVHCSKCRKEFLAFDALIYIAREWTNYTCNLSAMKAEVKSLTEQRENLRREVSNLKAMKKRAEQSKKG